MGEKTYQKFSDNLKTVMKKRGLKQVHIVTALGVSKGSVSGWCKGNNLPSAKMLYKLADFLEVPVSDLLGEDISKKNRPQMPIINGAAYAGKTVRFDKNGIPQVLHTGNTPYAKWIGIHSRENGLSFVATCSSCKAEERQEAFLGKPLLKKFCPMCGAKMDETK